MQYKGNNGYDEHGTAPHYVHEKKHHLATSDNDMADTMTATALAMSLSQSLDAVQLARFKRLCQNAEQTGMMPHALPKAHMVRDFTQWFSNWLVQNEALVQRHEKAQACYEALTAKPIAMQAGVCDMSHDHKQARKALVLVQVHMPIFYK